MRDEHQRQGSSNVTVRNIITSMRLISELEWSEFVESVSLVDDTLRAGSDFAQMDFATRNLYRAAIEELASGSRLTEMEIARAALAAAGTGVNVTDRQRDPGYHLIAAGRRAFEIMVGYHAAVALAGPLDPESRRPTLHRRDPAVRGLCTRAAAIRAADARDRRREPGRPRRARPDSVAGCRGRVRESRDRRHPWRDDPAGAGAARGGATAPANAGGRTDAADDTRGHRGNLERLEIHYLASPDGELHFALLSDWIDADRTRRGRRRAARRRRPWHRAAESATPAHSRRLALHAAAPSAESGAIRSASGWAGNASAASSTS